VIDTATEELGRLAHAVRWVPGRRDGKRVHISTLIRWATSGVRGVKLETVRLGGALFTSREAIQRFAERLTAAQAGAPEPTRTVAAARRSHDAAMRACDEAGI
jgi:hypothetical protein